MSPLLTSDWHLDDDPGNEYRWNIFEQVLHALIQYKSTAVFILGDIIDRKDRHSGALVNRLVTHLRVLAARCPVVILRGNHDTPLRGPAFWEFLSAIDGINYITEPTPWHVFNDKRPDLFLLPFTAAPKEDWFGIKFSDYKALFMHATVTGAVVENGITMTNNKFPILPRGVQVYSGDVHTPQQVRNITYVGAPHPVKFGDRYATRMLLLDEEFGIKLELPLTGVKKHMIDIASLDDLYRVTVAPGDKVKIRFQCPPDALPGWGGMEAAISKWAIQQGVHVAGTEVSVESVYHSRAADPEQSPEQLLRDFAAAEGVTEALLVVGLTLLKEVR